MKIAAITDDGVTISQHFGRARFYEVFTVEDGQVIGQERREKVGHHDFTHEHSHDDAHGKSDSRGHGFGTNAARRHAGMIESITDCEVVLVRGMGRGAYSAMEQANIEPIITDIALIEQAVQVYLSGKIVNHTEKLH